MICVQNQGMGIHILYICEMCLVKKNPMEYWKLQYITDAVPQ